MARTISCLVATAMVPSAPPSASEPVSPHENHCRRRVEPQKSKPRTDQRATYDGQFTRSRHVMNLQVAGEFDVAREIRNEAECGGGDHHRNNGQTVETVGEIDRIAGAGDDQGAENDKKRTKLYKQILKRTGS